MKWKKTKTKKKENKMRINIEVEKLVELINIVSRIPNLKKVVKNKRGYTPFFVFFVVK